MTEPDILEEVAGAILDGKPVDWAAVQASYAGHTLLQQLQVLAAVKQVASTPPSDGASLQQWGHLRVLERIGRGAFGNVYRAWDTRLDREVALKLLPAAACRAEDPHSAIIAEGRLLARVRHPNVVTIYGAERLGDRIGLWMELVKGRTLEELLREGRRFTPDEVSRIGIELCSAVSAVHAAGLLHRDIKAQNVALDDDGRLVLMDFGAGWELTAGSDAPTTGTPLYLAPEVLSGEAATRRSDVYSIGVLLYHLLTGSYPVSARDLDGLRRAHAGGAIADVAITQIPAGLARALRSALHPDPGMRCESADALGAALAREREGERPYGVASSLGRFPLGRRGWLTMAVVVACSTMLALAALWTSGRPTRVEEDRTTGLLSPAAMMAASERRLMLAVLPFENLTGDPGQLYFSDGITEELIGRLGSLDPGRLGVVPRASVTPYRTSASPISDLRRHHGVDYVLQGSVRRDGSHVRITAQLVHAPEETRLWSRNFDRELRDVVDVQDDIARAVAEEIQLTLTAWSRQSPSGSLSRDDYEAYDLYLKGRYFWNKRTVADLEQAGKYFQQSIDRAPGYARAHAGLAEAYALMSGYTGRPSDEFIPRARAAAHRALALNPSLAEAHTALAVIAQSHDWDWAAAESAYRRALALDQNYATARHWYAELLALQGRFDEAAVHMEQARRLDPLSLIIRTDHAAILLYARQYDSAREAVGAVLEMEPGFPRARGLLVWLNAQTGMYAEALSEIDRWPDGFWAVAMRAYVQGRAGRSGEARASLHRLRMLYREERYDAAPMVVACIGVGDLDDAFRWLDRAVRERSPEIPALKVHPSYDPLRRDPRFAAVLARLGLDGPRRGSDGPSDRNNGRARTDGGDVLTSSTRR